MSSSAASGARGRGVGEVREVVRLSVPRRRRERRLLVEHRQPVRLDRLEHQDPRDLAALAVRGIELPDKALVDQRSEAVDRVQLDAGRCVKLCCHRLDRLDRCPGEDRQDLEQTLLRRSEQLVAPLDRRPEGLLPLGQVARATAERLPAGGEPVPQRLGREEVEPRCRELDRQRQPVEAAADVGNGGGVVVGEPEVGPDPARPLDKELDRLELAELIGTRGARRAGRQRQGWYGHELLAAHPERLAAGHEQLQPRAVGEELDERRAGDRDLLEVVEDDEELLGAELAAELIERRTLRGIGQPECGGDLGEHGVGVRRGDEVDEVDAVREPVDLVGGGPDRKPCLAGPTGPGERDETDAGVVQARPDRPQLGIAADEGGRLRRQVVRPEVEGRERRKLRSQCGMAELEQVLGAAQVLQAVLAQVAQGDARGKLPADERRGRLGQQDLSAVTGRHDPRRAVDGRAEEVAAARIGVAGVDAHPDADRARVRPGLRSEGLLGRDACGQRIGRAGEHGHHPVAGRLDDPAGRLADRRAQDDVVARQGGTHLVRVPLPQAGAALDVGEEEGRRAARRPRLGRGGPQTRASPAVVTARGNDGADDAASS